MNFIKGSRYYIKTGDEWRGLFVFCGQKLTRAFSEKGVWKYEIISEDGFDEITEFRYHDGPHQLNSSTTIVPHGIIYGRL